MSNWPELPEERKVTASVGAVCITRASDLALGELMEMMLDQLHHAKEMGRNRAVMNARETAQHLTGM